MSNKVRIQNCTGTFCLRRFLPLVYEVAFVFTSSTKSPITSKRIANIIDYMTYAVYKYAARGLYESDKLMFTILLTLKVDMVGGKVKHEEFSTLITGTPVSSRCFMFCDGSTVIHVSPALALCNLILFCSTHCPPFKKQC